jgi:hypothetical protein
VIRNPAPGTSFRSTVGVGPDDLVTVYVIEGSEASGLFDAQFQQAMRAQGVTVSGPARSVIAGDGAFTYGLAGLRGPTGLVAEARRTFVFGARRVVVVSCQWTSSRTRAALLRGCGAIQRSLALTG